MTGGLAYVLDERGDFRKRINPDMVRAERLGERWQLEELRFLIEQHVELTGSARGRDLLDRWDEVQDSFWHVVPKTVEAAPLRIAIPRIAEGIPVA